MKKLLYLTLLLAFIVVSCDDPNDLEDKKKITDKSFTMEFKEIFNTNSRFQYKFEVRQTYVLKSKEDENSLFTNHIFDMTMPASAALPEIDYENKMLLCIVYPMQSSGSNKLTITDVKMNEGIIEVNSELFVPGIGTDDIGMPVVFVEVDKYDNEVKFLPTNEIFGATNNDDLLGKTWKLKYTKNPNGTTTEPEFYREADSQWKRVILDPFTINFNSDNTVNGKSNCNTWDGKYIINGNNIEFTELSSTEAACAYSDKFQSLLINSTIITYTADSVYIQSEINNEKYKMVFFYFNPQIENNIPRTAWRLSAWSEDGGLTYNGGYNDNGTFVDLMAHYWTLNFNNGIAFGGARCENFETIYTLDLKNANIAFNSISSDGSDCSFNQKYFELLNNSTSYDYRHSTPDRLTLYDAQRKTVLRFYYDFTVQSRWLAGNNNFVLQSIATIDKSSNVSNVIDVEKEDLKLKTNSDFSFSGNGECNTFMGNFFNYNDVGETNARIVPTKIACSSLEENYFHCLNSTTHFKWENENLILFNYEDGKEFNYLVFKMTN